MSKQGVIEFRRTKFGAFLALVRLGIGRHVGYLPPISDWSAIEMLAEQQGLSAVIVDGVEKIQKEKRPPQDVLLRWIGTVLQEYEYRYDSYRKAIAGLAGWYNQHGYKMMVLKGYACSLDWPKSEHRPCGDIDIWQFGKQEEADAALAASSKFQDSDSRIDNSHHHHTVFEWQGFTVENHYDFINVHHHPSHRGLEAIFKELGRESHTDNTVKGMQHQCVDVCGEKIYLPSPNLHALFLLRHALNHFASIGINLRNVLDWAFFVEKHTNEIDWNWLDRAIDEYHMRDFYNCINAICVEDMGFSSYIFPLVQLLPNLKDKVLNEILHPAIPNEKPKEVFQRIVWKVKRWKANKWKHELCYEESMWSTFWYGVWGHLLKPSSI